MRFLSLTLSLTFLASCQTVGLQSVGLGQTCGDRYLITTPKYENCIAQEKSRRYRVLSELNATPIDNSRYGSISSSDITYPNSYDNSSSYENYYFYDGSNGTGHQQTRIYTDDASFTKFSDRYFPLEESKATPMGH